MKSTISTDIYVQFSPVNSLRGSAARSTVNFHIARPTHFRTGADYTWD